jgi:hypothetical protein
MPMHTATKTRDDWAKAVIARSQSRWSRRAVLERSGGVLAAAFATVVLGPLGDNSEAFAESSTCDPPCSAPGHPVYCSGCSASGNCPSGFINCTNKTPYEKGPNGQCCPWSSGWWYTSGKKGKRHKCRDCRVAYCPCCCSDTCCAGFCGCRSRHTY